MEGSGCAMRKKKERVRRDTWRKKETQGKARGRRREKKEKEEEKAGESGAKERGWNGMGERGGK